MLVRGVVVAGHVQVHVRAGGGDLLEELEELLVPAPGVAGIGHSSGGDVEGGEQAGGPVTGVVVGLPLGDAGAHRQDRLGPFQGLALALLIHARHDRVLRRVQVQAGHVADFRLQLGAGGELEPLGAVRLQAEPPPQPGDRVVADLDLPGPGQPVLSAG